MHTHKRLTVVTALTMLIVPLGISGLVLRAQTQDDYEAALEQLQSGYREGATLSVTTDTAERIIEDLEARQAALEKRKRELRVEISVLIGTLGAMEKQHGDLANQEERTQTLLFSERERLAAFLRGAYVHRITDSSTGPVAGRLLLRRVLGDSLGESVDAEVRSTALAQARTRLMTRVLQASEFASLSRVQLHEAASEWAEKLTALQEEREDVLKEYQKNQRTLDRTKRTLEVSEEELAEIQRITEAVQRDILQMQGELARIDTRLRIRAERELIQKGLREERPGWFREPEDAGDQTFTWPVSGPISAGFHDARYLRYFRVPHNGIDIVVPQGTPVTAAAPGIVFIVRPGGARGYTYILIGHRDGYATLYGHLSATSVTNGQEVSRGQVIGLSGGAPGTDGAGPMTTGAHLHFEMLKNGAHIDARTELP